MATLLWHLEHKDTSTVSEQSESAESGTVCRTLCCQRHSVATLLQHLEHRELWYSLTWTIVSTILLPEPERNLKLKPCSSEQSNYSHGLSWAPRYHLELNWSEQNWVMMSWCLMSSDVIWHIRDKLWPVPKHGSIKATYVRCMRV